MIRRVEVQGFKCLHDVKVDLGPFNVLIGPNDSGKTSFLQALWCFWRPMPGSAIVSLTADDGDVFSAQFDQRGAVFLVNNKPALPLVEVHAKLAISEILALDPRAIASLSMRGTGNLAQLIGSRGQGATAHLARMALGDRARYDSIQEGMRSITKGRIMEAVVGEDTGQGYPLSFRLYDRSIIPASELSQGLLLYFAFLTLVHRDDPPKVLLIEEPENGVHPLRLFEVVSLLRTLTESGVQIIMTTHSPDLLNACKPDEVLVFRRPEPTSGTEVHRLPADFERRAMRSSLGEIWASSGEEGLLDMLQPIDPSVQAAE